MATLDSFPDGRDAVVIGVVRDSKYRFTRVGSYSHLFFLTQGYAVMDRAAMPVVGPDPETVNDTFIDLNGSNPLIPGQAFDALLLLDGVSPPGRD